MKLYRMWMIYVLKNEKLIAHNRWLADKGEKTLRLEYPLTSDSIVFDVGGYKGEFAEDVYNKYACEIYVFEPVKELYEIIVKKFLGNTKVHVFNFGLSDSDQRVEINLADNSSSIYVESKEKEKIKLVSITSFIKDNNIEQIDLFKINIEGGEYSVLPNLINSGFVKIITNLQVQFHDFVSDAINKRIDIRCELSKTHKVTYDYFMIWENWERMD